MRPPPGRATARWGRCSVRCSSQVPPFVVLGRADRGCIRHDAVLILRLDRPPAGATAPESAERSPVPTRAHAFADTADTDDCDPGGLAPTVDGYRSPAGR